MSSSHGETVFTRRAVTSNFQLHKIVFENKWYKNKKFANDKI